MYVPVYVAPFLMPGTVTVPDRPHAELSPKPKVTSKEPTSAPTPPTAWFLMLNVTVTWPCPGPGLLGETVKPTPTRSGPDANSCRASTDSINAGERRAARAT